MTTPITDEYIAQHPVPGPHGSRRWCCDECSWKYEERLRERIRADAATISDLRRQVSEMQAWANSPLGALHEQNAHEMVARLRAVARAVLALDCCGGDGYRACEAMGAALSALAPGDLGGEGK